MSALGSSSALLPTSMIHFLSVQIKASQSAFISVPVDETSNAYLPLYNRRHRASAIR